MEKITKIEPNRAFKARLFTTPKQEQQFKNNMQLAMSAYNYARGYNLAEVLAHKQKENEYKETLQGTEDEIKDLIDKWRKDNPIYKAMTDSDKLRKVFLKYIETKDYYKELLEKDGVAKTTISYVYFYNYPNAIKSFTSKMKQNSSRVRDKRNKNKNWTPKFPQDYGFPQKKLSEDSYYITIHADKIDYERNRIFISKKIGWVKIPKSQPIPIITKTKQDSVISTDGKHFYISIPYYSEYEPFKTESTDVLGVNMMVSDAIVLSNGTKFVNPNNTDKIKKLIAKQKKLQKKLTWLKDHSPKSWNIEDQKEKWKAVESRQTRALNRKIRNTQLKINHYKQNYMHECAEQIVKLNPKGLVFKKLEVQKMQKNKRMAKHLQLLGMYTFMQVIIWHATKHCIPVKIADKYYETTQRCSHCGHINEKMKGIEHLYIRTFECPYCGNKLDRGINSALNLKELYDVIPEPEKKEKQKTA